MLLARPTTHAAGCPRCGSPMYRDYDGDSCCLFCGEYVYVGGVGARADEPPLPELPRAPRQHGRPHKALAVA